MKMFLWVAYAALMAVIFTSKGFGQKTLITGEQYQRFLDARQWFREEQYQMAYPVFKDIEQSLTVSEITNKQLHAEELRFYQLACELMENNETAQRNAEAFLASNASNDLKGQLGYYLGSYYFRKQDYAKAADAFSQAAVGNLNNNQVATMQFQQGYSYLVQKQFASAKPLLNSVRQSPESPYYSDANYYYGLLAFNDKQYREAIQAFEVAKNDARYKPLVPYYSASINYALGEKEKGMTMAEQALKQGNQYYSTELKQLLGHGYFEKGDYKKALPYLEEYVNATSKVKKEDLYELAYCYYISGQYTKAIDQFKPLAGGQDSLSHHAMYLLGDSYLKTNQKANARNAFLFCSTNSSSPVFKEISLFNYGKLSYEIGLDNDALVALKDYVAKYPAGKYNTEAKDLLVGVLSNTSNYKEALELYEALPGRSENAQRQYPRILYNRAQELLNDRNLAEGDKLLDKCIAAKYNEAVRPLAYFWKGELAFASGRYADAAEDFSSYLQNPVTNGEANPDNARYGLGYSLLRLEQYNAAEKEFSALAAKSFANKQQAADVALRLADCYYMQKSFSRAMPLYNRISTERGYGADYAIYQTGMIAGAQNKPADKVNALRSLEVLYPQSQLTGTSYMEIADTYLADEKFKESLPWLDKIILGKTNESLKPEAYLKSGLANYNLGNSNEALQKFKSLVKQYPKAQESEDAIDNVRSIYVEQGKPEAYVSFLNEVGRKVDNSTADSLTYAAAELQLSDGKKDLAFSSLKNYIQKYPDGRYALEANYQVAEISREKKDLKGAAGYYDYVASRAPNKYAENALLQQSRLYYFEFKDYAKACTYYSALKAFAVSQNTRLEAMRGLLRCQYFLKDYAGAEQNARELLEQGGIGTDDKIFANLALGKQSKQTGNCAAAIGYFKNVVSLSKAESGAEARYEEAACLFDMNKFAEAEKAAFDLIKKSGSYEWWVTRSYILLGDIYLKQNDFFNAKATYKSVAENAAINELKKEAAEKLANAEKQEAAQSKIGG